MDALECRRRMQSRRQSGYVKKVYRLIPSAYALSNENLTITDASNMYNNTDNTTYATVTNNSTGTAVYYLYIKGFNFSIIPSNAVIESFVFKFKANQSGGSSSTGSNYIPRLFGRNNILKNGTASPTIITGTVQSFYFTNITNTWSDWITYPNDVGIRLSISKASSSNPSNYYVYGAEIEVTALVPLTPHTVRLVPSAVAKQQNVSATAITDGSNMLTDTDSDTYGVATNTIGSTYSIRLYGFNFSSVPSGAIVTNYVLKIKLYENGWRRTAGSNIVNCYNGGNTYIANSSIPATDLPVGTTPTIISKQKFTDWNTLCNYSDFRVCIALSKQTDLDQCAVYIYGCEIEVTYLSAD